MWERRASAHLAQKFLDVANTLADPRGRAAKESHLDRRTLFSMIKGTGAEEMHLPGGSCHARLFRRSLADRTKAHRSRAACLSCASLLSAHPGRLFALDPPLHLLPQATASPGNGRRR